MILLRGAVQKRLTLLTDMPLSAKKMYGFVGRGKLPCNFLTFFVFKTAVFIHEKKLTFQPQKIRIEFELFMQYYAIIE